MFRCHAIGVAVLAVVLPACRDTQAKTKAAPAVPVANVIQVDGATAAFPITEAVAAEFRQIHSDFAVNVGLSGTGVGFQKFCSGDNDILEASRPIKTVEDEACGRKDIQYVELPIAYDAVAVIANPGNNWVEELSVSELKAVWDVNSESKVMKWRDIRPNWPDLDLHLFGPGLDSGAFDYFTAVVNGAEGVGRGDYTATEDEKVLVSAISRDRLALGYLGFAYYLRYKDALKLIALKSDVPGQDINPLIPSTAAILNGTYPLSRPLFLYVNLERSSRPDVARFIEFYLRNLPRIAADMHYVPLPGRAYVLGLDRYRTRTTGSMFNENTRTSLRIDRLVSLLQGTEEFVSTQPLPSKHRKASPQ